MNLRYVISFLACMVNIYAKVPTIGLNFPALTTSNARSLFASPQNPTGDVGPKQYIMQCYMSIKTFDKTTGNADGVMDIDSAAFFGIPGGVGDVRLLYDRFSKRWFSSGESFNNMGMATNLNFAVSSDAVITPETTWSFYEVPGPQINPNGGPGGSLDYNQPATDAHAWYNGVSTFDGNGNFIGSSLVVIPTRSILSGAPHITVFPNLFPEVVDVVQEGFACPAQNFDPDPTFGYFLWAIYDTPESIQGNRIELYRILECWLSISNIRAVGNDYTAVIIELCL